jgi:hypothetical protein
MVQDWALGWRGTALGHHTQLETNAAAPDQSQQLDCCFSLSLVDLYFEFTYQPPLQRARLNCLRGSPDLGCLRRD